MLEKSLLETDPEVAQIMVSICCPPAVSAHCRLPEQL